MTSPVTSPITNSWLAVLLFTVMTSFVYRDDVMKPSLINRFAYVNDITDDVICTTYPLHMTYNIPFTYDVWRTTYVWCTPYVWRTTYPLHLMYDVPFGTFDVQWSMVSHILLVLIGYCFVSMAFHDLLQQAFLFWERSVAILITSHQDRMQYDKVGCNPGGKLITACTVLPTCLDLNWTHLYTLPIIIHIAKNFMHSVIQNVYKPHKNPLYYIVRLIHVYKEQRLDRKWSLNWLIVHCMAINLHQAGICAHSLAQNLATLWTLNWKSHVVYSFHEFPIILATLIK